METEEEIERIRETLRSVTALERVWKRTGDVSVLRRIVEAEKTVPLDVLAAAKEQARLRKLRKALNSGGPCKYKARAPCRYEGPNTDWNPG